MSVSLSIWAQALYRNPLFLFMKQFESYFTEKAIITHLCKMRVKIAKNRNKKYLIHLLTDSENYNYHKIELSKFDNIQNDFQKYQKQLLDCLSEMLPSRKKWIKLGVNSRLNKKNNESLTSNDKNFYSLLKTIQVYRKKDVKVEWLIKLDKFVEDLKNSIIDNDYVIESPVIYPKLKDDLKLKEKNVCRPISLFSLKNRIILSLTNNYLTKLFDDDFQDSSYAFRSKKNKNNSAILTHHDCIKDIIELQKSSEKGTLWVVECDMEKFYDSVNHKIIKKLFDDLIIKANEKHPNLDLSNAKNIFYQFLDCYAFNKNIPKPSDLKYWESYKIPLGEFGWVEKELKEKNYYKNIEDERIGVPQGGALSGLIANIALNETDKKMLETKVFYIRFCDDMLIIHNDYDECNNAKEIYINSLEDLKLVPHPFKNNINLKKQREKQHKNKTNITLKPFWKGKSKGPYKWDSIEEEGFPWIGFVGYEIHHEGYIRVRKKSLEKELNKQEDVVSEIKKAIDKGLRKSINYVKESAINRLIGMSVGRVNLTNFDKISNDMCWKNGFKELTNNKYSINQLKHLDRNRNRLVYNLLKELEEQEEVEKFEKFEEPKNKKNQVKKKKSRQIIDYNKPFSYYYQVIERNND